MKRLNAILVLFSAVLIGGCQVEGDDSTSAKEGKAGSGAKAANGGKEAAKSSGGILSVLKPEPITVPEGATFPLVLETSISSATSSSGDRVVARLAEDVMVGEKVAVPAGTEFRGLVTTATPSGKVKGLARLAFDFDTFVLKGKEHSIGSKGIDITAANSHKKDAATIGIGAGAGAIVGGIADGKKGAGIGALIGGATGTGVVLATKGKEVELSAGSRVTVVLTREARL
jgi:hypothetical protein